MKWDCDPCEHGVKRNGSSIGRLGAFYDTEFGNSGYEKTHVLNLILKQLSTIQLKLRTKLKTFGTPLRLINYKL